MSQLETCIALGIIAFVVVVHKNMNKKGFTLIELLLYVAISAMLITAVFTFMSLMNQSKSKAIAITEVEEQGRDIMQSINRGLRNANAINSPSPQTSSPSMTVSGANTNMYTLSANTLYLSVNGGVNVPLHNNQVQMSNLSFYNMSLANTPGIVRVQFDLSYANPENRNERNYQKTFYSSASLRP